MSWPRFSKITEEQFRKLKADNQRDVVSEAKEYYPDLAFGYGNPSARWQLIRRAQELFREDAARLFQEPKAGGIRQSRADADFFATFPPFPFAGEICDCPACREARRG